MKSSTSCPSSSRKYSATVSPVRPTRARAPGGSFIWPYTSAALEPPAAPWPGFLITPPCIISWYIVALAGALADAGEHRVPAVLQRDVVDQLHDDHRLAHASTPEQPNLTTLRVRREEVNDLDTREQLPGLRVHVRERRRRAVDRKRLLGIDRPHLVDGLANDVHDAAKGLRPDRHRDRRTRVDHTLAAHEAVRPVHGDGAHGVLPQVLRNLEHQAHLVVLHLQRVEDRRQPRIEAHVHHRADHLRDLPHRRSLREGAAERRARKLPGETQHGKRLRPRALSQ